MHSLFKLHLAYAVVIDLGRAFFLFFFSPFFRSLFFDVSPKAYVYRTRTGGVLFMANRHVTYVIW